MKNSPELYRDMVTIAADYVKASAKKYLPDSPQKNFMLWILANDNPYQEPYLRMMGVAGSIEMEISLLKDTVEKNTFQQLQYYIGIINAYFAFETLSDNIATGLAESMRDSNATYDIQKKLLQGFNDAMISKLQGNSQSAFELLKPYLDLTKQISAYQRCLLPSQMYQFAKEYLSCDPSATIFDLEYSFFPILVLNIETCFELLNSMRDHPIYPFLKESLIARYAAVNALLQENNTVTLDALTDIGAKSMLVMPTLAFCVGALDKVSPNSKMAEAITNGLLIANLYSASLMVRLLNDIGTTLLSLNETAQDEFFRNIKLMAQQRNANSIFQFLSNVSELEDFFYIMARFRKDLSQGEFNICLDRLNTVMISDALEEFFERIIFYSKLYKSQEENIQVQANKLNQCLADPTPAQIALNFVKFHQKMYSREFETKYGDYAITRSSIKESS